MCWISFCFDSGSNFRAVLHIHCVSFVLSVDFAWDFIVECQGLRAIYKYMDTFFNVLHATVQYESVWYEDSFLCRCVHLEVAPICLTINIFVLHFLKLTDTQKLPIEWEKKIWSLFFGILCEHLILCRALFFYKIGYLFVCYEYLLFNKGAKRIKIKRKMNKTNKLCLCFGI